MESLEFKYGLDIHFCYNGNLGTLQQKTKDNKRFVYCLLYNKVITKEEYEQLVKEIVTYFQEQIQSVMKNPLYFVDQHLTTQFNHVIVKNGGGQNDIKRFLSVLNIQVKYRVIDRFNKKRVELKQYREDKETYDRNIYMVFQAYDGTLEIHLY